MFPPDGAQIAVAMSGGVDSSVAAARLVERGYACIGLTLRQLPHAPGPTPSERDARAVCERLGIPHHVVHQEAQFERDVMAYFVREYQAGRTPNPCVACNRFIKFGVLHEAAEAHGAPHVATGHYARRVRHGARWAVQRARFRPKDQSYMLAPLAQEQLARSVFPLGELSKEEVRIAAHAAGLDVASRSESQDICFVPDGDYAGFVAARSGAPPPGPILSTSGERLGTHHGLVHYTIGQRRGLGIAAPRPLYVVGIDPAANALIVAHEEETAATRFVTEALHWGALPPQREPLPCRVQLRLHHDPAPAVVTPAETGASVTLEAPERAITPGQWAVFYDAEECVLAAAVIERVEESSMDREVRSAGFSP